MLQDRHPRMRENYLIAAVIALHNALGACLPGMTSAAPHPPRWGRRSLFAFPSLFPSPCFTTPFPNRLWDFDSGPYSAWLPPGLLVMAGGALHILYLWAQHAPRCYRQRNLFSTIGRLQ